MGKIRKPGPALTRTYIRPDRDVNNKTFHARVIDVRSGSDIKCSGKSMEDALSCARTRAMGKGSRR